MPGMQAILDIADQERPPLGAFFSRMAPLHPPSARGVGGGGRPWATWGALFVYLLASLCRELLLAHIISHAYLAVWCITPARYDNIR